MPGAVETIGGGLSNAKEILGDRFATAYTEDEKLWFISRKGVEQPSISYFHETPLQGGNTVYFDVPTKTWSDPVSFSAISNEELLEGDIFGFGNRLLLVTYQKSHQFAFRDLYEWKDNEWRKVDSFRVDEKTKFDCGERANITRVADVAGSIYFLAERRLDLVVSRLSFADDGKKAAIEMICEVGGAFPVGCYGSHIVKACIADHRMHALYGEQGCGFHWDPAHPLRIDLHDGKAEQLKIGELADPRPPWSFSGAKAAYLVPPFRWFFFGGSRARGLSSTESDWSIWEMDLDKKEWKRFQAYDLPAGAHFVGAKKNPVEFYAANIADGGIIYRMTI